VRFVYPGGFNIHPEVFGSDFLFGFWRPTGVATSRSDLFVAPGLNLGFSFRKSPLTLAPCRVLTPFPLAPVGLGGLVDSSSLIRMGVPPCYLAERLLQSVYSTVQHKSTVGALLSSGASPKALYEAIRAPNVAGARKSVNSRK
jgi:hypothetical protein